LIYIPEEFGSNPGPDTVYPDWDIPRFC
jgi:hypothetical protein